MRVHDAVDVDIEQITAIYNDVLQSSTAIFSDQLATVQARREYWLARLGQGFPLLVAAETSDVLGYATFGEFRSGPGYRRTVEGTIHVHAKARRSGVGHALMAELLLRAQAAGKHVMVAGVDAANVASQNFLRGFGFEQTGHMREVGYKFGRYLDLIFLQKVL